MYAIVSTDEGEVFTAKQIKEFQKRNALLEEVNLILKKCHIHAPLEQRLNTVNILKNEHSISTLCRVLNVNRSTYYKHFCSPLSNRELKNQDIKFKILSIYTSSKKDLDTRRL